jgi:hypothetical protein
LLELYSGIVNRNKTTAITGLIVYEQILRAIHFRN